MKHGFSRDKFYLVYRGMLSRCYISSDTNYKNYGAKGITVCEKWLGKNGFQNFKNDMYEKYLEHKSKNKTTQLDKDFLSEKLGIFPGIYSKETCCFLTAIENNSRRNKIGQYDLSGKLLKTFNSVIEAANFNKILRTSIGNNINLKSKTCNGFIFKYI